MAVNKISKSWDINEFGSLDEFDLSQCQWTMQVTELGDMVVLAQNRSLIKAAFVDGKLSDVHHDWQNQAQQVAELPGIQTPYWNELTLIGTPFQRRVWRALLDVAPGKTVSYQDLANRIGHSNGFRAVGNAVGANPLALVIPCHRVIRSDGGIGGYRWGTERKRQILKLEAALNTHDLAS